MPRKRPFGVHLDSPSPFFLHSLVSFFLAGAKPFICNISLCLDERGTMLLYVSFLIFLVLLVDGVACLPVSKNIRSCFYIFVYLSLSLSLFLHLNVVSEGVTHYFLDNSANLRYATWPGAFRTWISSSRIFSSSFLVNTAPENAKQMKIIIDIYIRSRYYRWLAIETRQSFGVNFLCASTRTSLFLVIFKQLLLTFFFSHTFHIFFFFFFFFFLFHLNFSLLLVIIFASTISLSFFPQNINKVKNLTFLLPPSPSPHPLPFLQRHHHHE